MTRIQIPPIDFHGGQQAVITHPARFKVISAGRRFGKTLLAVEWLALFDDGRSAIEGASVAFFAPTYRLLADVWADMERTLKPVTRKANRTEQRIELITGGKIDFWTLEDPDAGRGRKYHKIVIDEAAHARYLKDAWEQAISPTLTDFRGQAWFISTPKGTNYFHELFRRGQSDEWPEWASFHLPTSANPYISADEIEAKRRELPALVFAQEYEAQFVTFGGNLIRAEMLVDAPCPPHLPVCLGVDLAISSKEGADFTAIAAMARDPETGIVYVKEVERGRWQFHEAQQRIKAAAARHRPKLIAVEQTQYQAAMVQELLRTTTLPVRGIRPERDKVTRFAPLLTRFEQHQVRLDPAGVPSAVRDELLAFPEGEHDDCVDAASYAFAAFGMAVGGYAAAGTRVF
ncbi:phage terminase large subunit [Caldimonas taiwanensis]|uniref:phage terminase large subunit n=1 Tax=Caldimonas taiwanensis TaxID=307483 RepID=UPI0007805AA5|nr:phage terminase large subunit [Caldimonas taiwanensis]